MTAQGRLEPVNVQSGEDQRRTLIGHKQALKESIQWSKAIIVNVFRYLKIVVLVTTSFALGFAISNFWNELSIWCEEEESKIFEQQPETYVKAKAYIYSCGAGGPTTSRVAVSYFKAGLFSNGFEFKDIFQTEDGVLADIKWQDSDLHITQRSHTEARLKTVKVHGHQVVYRAE